MGEVTDFDFEAWAKSAKLPTEVVSALKSECFNSNGALLQMTEADISDLNLGKKGLVRCLQGAMCRLQTTHGEGPLVTKPSPKPTPTKASVNSDPRKAPGHPEEVLKQLDSILGNIGTGWAA